ncbi:MAG: haloacid dehalogenase type II, partial [Nitrospinaceae bacterium]|nr:haloacid dehalogenase type II [Nitrospinaceae bacterium]NIR56445.1 haloacid dehalogenase type II [Nitrospinaceae bacterium]NIS86907.1 haloacid dehalogenase type II [Nitrospinaceae bacterium]NIT83744.1 haloacid dehalogenase type II [Nitrospinaceae bacterium]NIU45948.1 haloacid dehalogenase type II [Nitrospinaceae bacterium]
MRNYRDFSVCSRQALEFACLSFGVRLSADETKKILEATETLPAFPEVRDGLERCQAAGFRLFAFSNGSREAVRRGLHGAALEVYFQ